MLRYKYINHTADLGIKIYGRTRLELFKNAGRAVFETMLILRIRKKAGKTMKYQLSLNSESFAELLVDWLREILYYFSVKKVLPRRYRITFQGNQKLKAWIEGVRYKTEDFRIRMEIKNVTYHNLKIRKNARGYTATVIFDV